MRCFPASSYTDKLTHAGIDILCFSTGNSVNILVRRAETLQPSCAGRLTQARRLPSQVPQPKLLLARRILQVGH